MITELTPKQAEKFPEFMDKWATLASGDTNHAACTKVIKSICEAMGKKWPQTILHFSSPILATLASCILGSQLGSQLYSQLYSQLDSQLRGQLGSQLGGQLYSQLYSQLGSQLGSQLYSQLDSQLYSQLGSQLGSQLNSQLGSQLYSQLGSQLRGQLGSQLGSQLYSQLYSQLDSQLGSRLRGQLGGQLGSQLYSQLDSHYIVLWWGTWVCYYDFAEYIGIRFDTKKLNLFRRFVKNIHSCLPYKNIFFYSDKPIKCHWKGRRLHNENGMAVEYADRWGWYALNGVVMKPEYVLTPAEKLRPDIILKETNVDIRRELLRKIGVQRMLSYGEEIDSMGSYKLVDMSPVFTGIRYAPHLLMKNPSVDDTWHLEGIGPECHTVQEAINWRAGNVEVEWSPAQLS
jgi:hypothetical protein